MHTALCEGLQTPALPRAKSPNYNRCYKVFTPGRLPQSQRYVLSIIYVPVIYWKTRSNFDIVAYIFFCLKYMPWKGFEQTGCLKAVLLFFFFDKEPSNLHWRNNERKNLRTAIIVYCARPVYTIKNVIFLW